MLQCPLMHSLDQRASKVEAPCVSKKVVSSVFIFILLTESLALGAIVFMSLMLKTVKGLQVMCKSLPLDAHDTLIQK